MRIYLSSGESAVGTELVEYERIKEPHVSTSGRHLLHSTKLSFFLGSHNGRCVTYLHHQAGCGTLQKRRKKRVDVYLYESYCMIFFEEMEKRQLTGS